ncbi:hypothetical protein VTJ49DRAFT_6423 [Mycothermus thermophilus]|uniref:Autophagy-related protein 28 n=1 Tax=Humicola insolens TaxID=85995 RepID=A0ABR3VK90_HUMIN
MSSKSSFLPLSRDGPILPLHNRTSPPIRKKPSEYSLAELSPHADDDDILPARPNTASDSDHRYASRRSPSPSPGYGDKSKPKEPILFAGPPPPIARSMMLYRDEEDRDTSHRPSGPASSLARNINSVLFDHLVPSPGGRSSRDTDFDPKPDPVWLTLQRRERALQREIQFLLDAQSAGLAANLEPPPSDQSDSKPSRSSTPTASASSSYTTAPSNTPHSRRTSRPNHNRRVSFDPHPPSSPTPTTSSGTPIPVRQPKPKPPTLRSARAGLARAMAALLELRADEDAALSAALAARKQALARLRRWGARRESVVRELKALEEGDASEDPLGRELGELRVEREQVRREVEDLEGRLRALRQRGRELDNKIREVESRRESGLSGYRGALREVEGRIEGLLTRPGVRPLDVGVLGPSRGQDGEDGEVVESPGGVEFLRLRPERRTMEMARDWWEAEVAILERRKAEVDRERAALEEGAEVWQQAVKMVSEFEKELRREMSGAHTSNNPSSNSSINSGSNKIGEGKGRSKSNSSASRPLSPSPSPAPSTPEQTMLAQLDKMRAVMSRLADLSHVAEDRGWNLLICAIGAELDAFRQADRMLRDALRAAGLDVPSPADEGQHDEDGGDGAGDERGGGDGIGLDGAEELTPRLGRSVNLSRSAAALGSGSTGSVGKLVDVADSAPSAQERRGDRDPESSDNEVPPDLLAVAAEEEEEEDEHRHGHELLSSSPPPPSLSRESSNNEVPPEFLVEHDMREDEEGGVGGPFLGLLGR